MKRFNLDGIEVEVIKKKVRRFNLHVAPGRVWMSMPLHVSDLEAERFVRNHLDWIREQQFIHMPQKPITNTIFLWGRSILLRFEEGIHRSVLTGDTLTLCISSNATDEEKRAVLNVFYGEELERALPEACARWEAVTGVCANEYRVRTMKTRWGTCSLRLQRIWINTRLVAYFPEVLDYILVHELTHLIVPNHSAEFWNRMDQFYPNWRMIRAHLRQKDL